jgi:HK97 gp10 family phage protein
VTVRIRLTGSDALQAALREASGDVRAAVAREVTATAIRLRKDIVRSIQRGPASGETYVKYKPRRVHTASAPGQAPASDTGRLANSIEWDVMGPMTATVGSKLAYAVHLEYGTRKMAARPFFRPAVERMRKQFNARLNAAISGALK